MIIYLFRFGVGTMLASFLNVVAQSVPIKQNWWSRRSCCLACQKALQPTQLIPILSYLIQKGQCKFCQTKIPVSYLLVEIAGGLLFILANTLQAWLFFALLLTVTLTDLYYRLIPNRILIAFGVPLFLIRPNPAPPLIGFLFLLGAALLSRVLSNKDTIGGGDIKLYLVIGTVLSIQEIFRSITLASLVALIYVLVFFKNKKQEIPFAPFIALGSLFVYLFW